MKVAAAVAVVFTLAIPQLAAADPAQDAAKVVGDYVSHLHSAQDDIAQATDPAKTCFDAVAAARKAGATELTYWSFKDVSGSTPSKTDNTAYAITIDRADAVCQEYSLYEKARPAVDAFNTSQNTTDLISPQNAPGPDFIKSAYKQAKDCAAKVDALLKDKVPSTFQVKVGANTYTLGEIKVKVCDAETAAAAKYSKEAAAALKRAQARYHAAGISGDKMDFMMEYANDVFLPGGASSTDLKKYAAASVLFVWTTSGPPQDTWVTHTIRRYEFSGNKLVKTTSESYWKPRNASMGQYFH